MDSTAPAAARTRLQVAANGLPVFTRSLAPDLAVWAGPRFGRRTPRAFADGGAVIAHHAQRLCQQGEQNTRPAAVLPASLQVAQIGLVAVNRVAGFDHEPIGDGELLLTSLSEQATSLPLTRGLDEPAVAMPSPLWGRLCSLSRARPSHSARPFKRSFQVARDKSSNGRAALLPRPRHCQGQPCDRHSTARRRAAKGTSCKKEGPEAHDGASDHSSHPRRKPSLSAPNPRHKR